MERTTLAYIAGIIDGEGTIFATKRKDGNCIYYQQGMRVHMKYSKIPLFLQKHLGGRYYNKEYNEDGHMWTIYANDTRKLCKQLLPYLIEKKRQAEIILELEKFKYTRSPKIHQLAQELKSLHN